MICPNHRTLGCGCKLAMRPVDVDPAELARGPALGPVPKTDVFGGVVVTMRTAVSVPGTASGIPFRPVAPVPRPRYATMGAGYPDSGGLDGPRAGGNLGGRGLGQDPGPSSVLDSPLVSLAADAGAVLVGGVAAIKTEGWTNTLGWVLAVVGSLRVMNDFSRIVSE